MAVVMMVLAVPRATGNFLYFKPGQEYQYKFTSDTNMKGIDKFTVVAKVCDLTKEIQLQKHITPY